MASRYWVGGAGNWSDNTNHWASTSGGAPGASLPTSADDVFFDTLSNATGYTVTIDATTKVCRDITFAAPLTGNVTLSDGGANRVVQVYGSVSFYSGMTLTFNSSGATYFQMMGGGTNTINSNGVAATYLQLWFFGGTGGSWTFTDNWSGSYFGGTLNGTVDLNGKTFTLSHNFDWNSSATGIINFGACTISSDRVTIPNNYTLNTATSIVSWTFARSFNGGGKTFGGTVTLSTYPYHYCYLQAADTFNNLTINGTASIAMVTELLANIIVTGTLTITGYSTIYRNLIQSSVKGTPRTITAAVVLMSNVDIMDIIGAGAASWDLSAITGGSGDCDGNSGITFTPEADQYWYTSTTGSKLWSTVGNWFLGSGGTGGAGRVPLPQDDVIFDSSSIGAASTTINTDMPRIGGSITFVGVANTPILNFSIPVWLFGSLAFGTLTFGGSAQAVHFCGRGSYTLLTAGRTITSAIVMYIPGVTLTLQDALTCGHITAYQGTFDANDFNVTFYTWNANAGSSPVGTIYMGNGTWNSTYTAGNAMTIGPSATLYSEGSTLRFSGALIADLSLAGGGKTFNNLVVATTGAFAFHLTGSNTFNNIDIDARQQPQTIKFTAGTTTTVTTFTRDSGVGHDIGVNYGASIGAVQRYSNIITIGSITASNHTLTKVGGGTIILDYMDISRSTANPARTWHATNSTDSGNNIRWTFGLPSSGLAGMMLRAGGVLTY